MAQRFGFGVALSFGLALGCLAAPPSSAQQKPKPNEDLAAACARVGNDDTIRSYSPSLLERTRRAYKTLAPDAKGVPEDSSWETQAQYRCMSGKVMVCFVGANLPCVKMNAARENPGATAFCRKNPNADGVSAAAVGHDAVYSYRCRGGRAEIVGEGWALDKRGFAKKLWTELPDR